MSSNRANRLRRLASKVALGRWDDDQTTEFSTQIAEALYGLDWRLSQADDINDALRGSINAARRHTPKGSPPWHIKITLHDNGLCSVLAGRKNADESWEKQGVSTEALDEAQARLSLALLMWAEEEEDLKQRNDNEKPLDEEPY